MVIFYINNLFEVLSICRFEISVALTNLIPSLSVIASVVVSNYFLTVLLQMQKIVRAFHQKLINKWKQLYKDHKKSQHFIILYETSVTCFPMSQILCKNRRLLYMHCIGSVFPYAHYIYNSEIILKYSTKTSML